MMINSGDANNPGGAELQLQVVLKADDNNRAEQELHTTLSLSVAGIEDGMEINLGWAMNLTPPEEIVDEGEEGKPDGQGTEVAELKKRYQTYTGPKGWDGQNAWAVYNGDGNGNWVADEVWQTEMPDVFNNGVAGLTMDATNNFVVFQEYSEITCLGGGNCEAVVVTERVWDTELTATGHIIEAKMERMFSFIAWY